ncbi:hypothetical protein C7A10_31500 [Pseudomonas fluorescens]|uniref:Uncharacterized protein n=1 Tax=Pseudomonas fluorescens TaxID=294 RepID=A0A2T0HJI4_PSEFL|nr:hypothetical protein C7A10_31500 [Pseudomonas fluorescens]
MTLSRPEPTLTGGDFQCRHCRLLAGSSPSLPDGSNPSAAIVQSASDVQCSRLLKTTAAMLNSLFTSCRMNLSRVISYLRQQMRQVHHEKRRTADWLRSGFDARSGSGAATDCPRAKRLSANF